MSARPALCRVCGLGPLIPRLRWRAGERDGLEHYGRGLCRGCWREARAKDSLANHEPVRHPLLAEQLAEYERLVAEGCKLAEIADRLGMTRSALDAGLARAVRAGLLTRGRPRKPLPQPLSPAEVARLRALVGAR